VIRSMRFKRPVARLLVCGLLWMTACTGDDAPDVMQAAAPPSNPDVVETDGTFAGYLYYAGNAHHERKMEALLARPDVGRTVARFAEAGFELSRQSSFTVEGTDGEMTASATFVAMDGTGGNADRSVTIACFHSGRDFRIAPLVYSTTPPPGERGWERIGDGGWIRTVGPEDIELSAQRFDRWSWSYFLECMSIRVPSIAAGCAFSCIMTPTFAHCFLICTATQAAGATVGCIIETFKYGGTDKKWQQ
jgi:hypothetical protein